MEQPATPWVDYTNIPQFYDRVRNVLKGVSDTKLPNATIDFSEKAPTADRMIKQRVPGWADLDADKFKIFESAIVYQTAVFFEGYVVTKTPQMQKTPTLQLQFNVSSFDVNGISLSDMVEILISEITGTFTSPPNFVVTKSARGRKMF